MVMTQRIADRDYYADAEGNLVDADDPNVATLVARAGCAISDQAVERYGLTALTEAPVYDAIADHAAKHGAETDEEARRKREAMLSITGGDDDGPAVDGERGEKAKSAPANKARGVTINKATPDDQTPSTDDTPPGEQHATIHHTTREVDTPPASLYAGRNKSGSGDNRIVCA